MGSSENTTEKKLIAAGVQLAKKHGLKFSVRQLCTKSKVNLGLFHYYFKNKDNFDKKLLTALYQQMLADIMPHISASAAPRENIRTILLGFHRFAGQNRMLLSSLMGDVLSGNKKMLLFLTQNFTRNLTLLSGEIKRAAVRPELKNQPVPALIAALVSPVIFPQMFVGLLERVGTAGLPFEAGLVTPITENENQLRARIETALDMLLGEER